MRRKFLIRRLKCSSCGRLHRELPDCLVPYKHYASEVISGVLDGIISPDDEDSADFPCEMTMRRWRCWLEANRLRIDGSLKSTGYLDILIEISDFYEVDLRELLDGERRSEKVSNENDKKEETVLKAVDYANIETERYTKRVHWLLLTGAIFWFISSLISHTVLDSNTVLNAISNFAEGAASGMIICGIVFTSRYSQRIKAFKQRLLKRQL